MAMLWKSFGRQFPFSDKCISPQRLMSVYTIGHGWTGALGTGRLESFAAGHEDEEEPDKPFLVYDGPVSSAAAGWGHTAFVSSGELYLCGRPHELSSLLRLKRFPNFLRMYAVNHALKYNHDGDDHVVTTSPSFPGRIIQLLVGGDEGPDGNWDLARRNSVLTTPTIISLPKGRKVSPQTSKALDASAGLTAVLSQDGEIYTFGMNHHGQCGIGISSTNVWTPEPVVGLSPHFASDGRENLEQEHPISQIALGLQHGVALSSQGHVYVWGKAERGQLGLKDNKKPFLSHATRMTTFRVHSIDGSQRWIEDTKITSIGAGMNHTAARGEDNTVFVWGKNIAPASVAGKVVQDSNVPVSVKGLPGNKEVIDISCGSHHTAMLMDDGSVYAVGVASDDKKPILDAKELIPPGLIDMPVRQFQAHFDRTTIVGRNGDQVVQAHLWSDAELQRNSAFTPTWMDCIAQNVRSVHRGWLHTVVVTDE